MVRDHWLNLNGLWDYALSPADRERVDRFEGEILVPFPIESALSGVKHPLGRDQRLWYRRTFRAPASWTRGRLLLHFGAVDWEATVWVDGHRVGSHQGGFTPFCFEISRALDTRQDHEIRVAVRDPTGAGGQARGKQARRPRWIFYTAVSGIWQTVWLEPVPDPYIGSLRMTPDIGAEELHLAARVESRDPSRLEIEAVARADGGEVGRVRGRAGEPLRLPVPHPRLWSPDTPFLYDLEVRLVEGDRVLDHVRSYFGMRELRVAEDSRGVPRLHLNGQACLLHGPLDQGYWPDGLYTAPTDEALRHDLELCKQLGFNLVRKHLKVEPARWYHHCDRLGLVVWQDVPSGGRLGWTRLALLTLAGLAGLRPRDDSALWRFGRSSPGSRQGYRDELRALIEALHGFPCIGLWTLFNEGWGQFHSAEIAARVRQQDPSRPIEAASGWFDQGAGDVRSLHAYPGPKLPPPAGPRARTLSELGGLGLAVPGHLWAGARTFAQRRLASREQLTQRYLQLLRALEPLVREGLSGAVYTQLTDVEGEINGLITYDRRVVKMDPARLREAHAALRLVLHELGLGDPLDGVLTSVRVRDQIQSTRQPSPAGRVRSMAEQKIGVVSHYFGNISVAGIDLTDGELRVGDRIHVKGHTSDFTQTVDSMQVEHQAVESARAGDSIGIRVAEHAREHDEVFKITPD